MAQDFDCQYCDKDMWLIEQNEALLALKKQWEEWMREWENTARNEARHEEATIHELRDLQQVGSPSLRMPVEWCPI